jgi:hypothetical protein
MSRLSLPTILRVMAPETKDIVSALGDIGSGGLRLSNNFLEQTQKYLSAAGDKKLKYGGEYRDTLFVKSLSNWRSSRITSKPHQIIFADIVIPTDYKYLIKLNSLNWTMVEVYNRNNSEKRFKSLINNSSLQGVKVDVNNQGRIYLSQSMSNLDTTVYQNWPDSKI